MFQQFTDRARNVMSLAADEARHMNHEYVGTEHVLAALVAQDSGAVAELLHMFDVDARNVGQEIEKLVQRGSTPVPAGQLPLTPRVQQVIEYARQEANSVGQKLVDTEHVLLGLAREPEGVAGNVLLNLGVRRDQLRAEALKIRFGLMKIVERAVRPVRASVVRKRQMREELLAHLTAIYEDELSRTNDPTAALSAAAMRFGGSAELASELESALPYYERLSSFFERWVLYRAPESAARYAMRLAGYTLAVLVTILSLVFGGVFLRYGWIDDLRTLLGVFGAIIGLTPAAQFVVTLAYIKLRDAMWGAFGSRKSRVRVAAFAAMIAIVSQLYLMGVAAVARMDLGAAYEAAQMSGAIGLVSGSAFVVLAYISGPTEIRDTQWALLDIETA
jgi:ATP-dependent Clp protease ATP-binding subunit ClpC